MRLLETLGAPPPLVLRSFVASTQPWVYVDGRGLDHLVGVGLEGTIDDGILWITWRIVTTPRGELVEKAIEVDTTAWHLSIIGSFSGPLSDPSYLRLDGFSLHRGVAPR